MPIIHYQNTENEYLCSHIIKPNMAKMTNKITDVNCPICLNRISKNDFTMFELIENCENQTSLTGLIF